MSATLQDKITASLSVLASTQTSHLMSALGLLTISTAMLATQVQYIFSVSLVRLSV